MRIQVSEEQYRNLVKKVFGVDVLKEQDTAAGDAAPKAGTSSDGEKKTNATKWESGVTRGPANQVGVTKWSDIVGATLKRGKANPLTEQDEKYTGVDQPPNIFLDKIPVSLRNLTLKQIDEQELTPDLPPALKDNQRLKEIKNFVENLDDLKNKKTTEDQKKTYAPPPKYAEDENRYEFIDNTLDQNNQEVLIKKINEGKKLSGVNKFKTYWGQELDIDCDKYDVILWKNNMNRQESFKIKNNKVIIFGKDKEGNFVEQEYTAPTEFYLKQVFKDDTIKNIVEKSTKKRYRPFLKWAYVKRFVETNPNLPGKDYDVASWVPDLNLGYGYPQSGEEKVLSGKVEIFPGLNEIITNDQFQELYIKREFTSKNESNRIENFRSYNNKKVPEGFDPNKYDEYLSKIKPLEWQIIENLRKLEQLEKKPIIDELKKLDNQNKRTYIYNLLNIVGPNDLELKKYTNELFSQLDQYYKQYRSPIGEGGVYEFSRGIDPKTRELYFKKQNETNQFFEQKRVYLNESISILKNVLYEKPKTDDEIRSLEYFAFSYYYWWNKYNSDLINIDEQKNATVKQLKVIFGNDYWKPSFMGRAFDEFWDNWGTLFQIIGNIGLIVASGGIAGALRAPQLIRYIAPYLADAAFNATVAAYQYNRNQNEEAFISLICAVIPVAKYGLNIGKVSQETAASLAKKLAEAPKGTLKDEKLFNEFLINLSDQEKVALQDIFLLPRQEIERVGNQLLKDIEDFNIAAKNLGTKVVAPKSELIKSFMKEFAFEGSIPLSASIANAILGIVENKVKLKIEKDQWFNLKQNIEKFLNEINEKEKNDKIAKQLSILFEFNKSKNNLNNVKNYEQVKNIIFKIIEEIAGKSNEEILQELENELPELKRLKDEIIRNKKKGEELITQNTEEPIVPIEPDVPSTPESTPTPLPLEGQPTAKTKVLLNKLKNMGYEKIPIEDCNKEEGYEYKEVKNVGCFRKKI